MTPTSDELKARLHHSTHELGRLRQLLATAADHAQAAFNEIQVCNQHADLIDPAFDALNHQVHALTEEMDRVYSLRNDENDLYLRQENSRLKKSLTALQQALSRERDEHQLRLAGLLDSNEGLTQRITSLERFNQLLKTKLNEMKELYDNIIIEVTDLKEKNKTLHNMSAFNVVANTAGPSITSASSLTGLVPFGKTVVETNRGLTVTIESSPAGSPDKASLNQGWIAPIPSGAAFPFPDIDPQPQLMGLDPSNGGTTQVAIRSPGRPKARPIVRGTQESNESFERMKRALLAPPPLATSTNVIKADHNTTVASLSSASGPSMSITNPFDPVTPSKVKSKLNPAVAAFTTSNSSGKDPAKPGSEQASSPSKNEPKPLVTVTTTEEDKFIPLLVRRGSTISTKEEPVTISEDLRGEDKVKAQGAVATSAQNEFSEQSKPVQTSSFAPRTPPHLRYLTSLTKNDDIRPFSAQPSAKGKNKEDGVYKVEVSPHGLALTGRKENAQAATTLDPGFQAWLDTQEKSQPNDTSNQESASGTNDMLIELDPDSPQASKKAVAPLPPGFIPFSANDDAPEKTETAAPIKTDTATFPVAVSDNLTAKNEEATAEYKNSNKIDSEKERNAAFLAEYTNKLNSVSQKYGRDSRDTSADKDKASDPVQNQSAELTYNPPKPTGTHELGALLDEECSKMVLKLREDVKMENVVGQEWKAVRKGGKIVYVL